MALETLEEQLRLDGSSKATNLSPRFLLLTKRQKRHNPSFSLWKRMPSKAKKLNEVLRRWSTVTGVRSYVGQYPFGSIRVVNTLDPRSLRQSQSPSLQRMHSAAFGGGKVSASHAVVEAREGGCSAFLKSN